MSPCSKQAIASVRGEINLQSQFRDGLVDDELLTAQRQLEALLPALTKRYSDAENAYVQSGFAGLNVTGVSAGRREDMGQTALGGEGFSNAVTAFGQSLKTTGPVGLTATYPEQDILLLYGIAKLSVTAVKALGRTAFSQFSRVAPNIAGASKLAENLATRKWPAASIEKAIERHAGKNYTSWVTDTGKRIYENPATGRQIVQDIEGGYFRIFQPTTIGSQKGTYLNMLGNELRPARFGKNGIQTPLLRDVDKDMWQQETHFFIQELLD